MSQRCAAAYASAGRKERLYLQSARSAVLPDEDEIKQHPDLHGYLTFASARVEAGDDTDFSLDSLL